MNPEYWHQKWKAGDIQFHQSAVEPLLVKYFPPKVPTTVIVPLCGKTLDLLWLRSQGHEVIGIELDASACESFFRENKISFTKTTQGEHAVYQGEGISIYCADIFKLPASVWNRGTIIYDRAACIALPIPLRDQYTTLITEQFRKNPNFVAILLITIDYPQESADGPPFSVSEKEVQRLYRDFFTIETLESEIDEVFSANSAKFKNLCVRENAFRLTRKN